MMQQVELLAGQAESSPFEGCLPRGRVDHQLADSDRCGALTWRRAAQQRPDASVELRRRERLDHVVVRPQVQAAHDLGLVISRRGDDDRHRADAAQHLEQLHPVEVGEAQVQHHHISGLGSHDLQRLEGVRRAPHRVAKSLQRPAEGAADPLVVLDKREQRHPSDYPWGLQRPLREDLGSA